jgi:probable rRNA maturation factor
MDEDRSASIQIEISDTQPHLRVDREALAMLARSVLAGEGVRRANISIALVDDAAIHALNRRHLSHDWPTDVITFRLSAPDEDELAADVILSAEMAKATALASGQDPQDELALYLVHGLLHLCGYDDQAAGAAHAMRVREAEVLQRVGRTNTFALTGSPTREDPPCSR